MPLPSEPLPQGTVKPAGFDGRSELQHPRLVSGKIQPRAPVISENAHFIDWRDALCFEAPPRADAIEKRRARRSQRVDARIPIGARRRRRLALDQGKPEPAFGKRPGQTRPGKPSTDDDHVKIHSWIVSPNQTFLTTHRTQKDSFPTSP